MLILYCPNSLRAKLNGRTWRNYKTKNDGQVHFKPLPCESPLCKGKINSISNHSRIVFYNHCDASIRNEINLQKIQKKKQKLAV